MNTFQKPDLNKTLSDLFSQAIHTAMGGLFSPETLLNGLVEATTLAHSLVSQVEELSPGPGIACRAGCSRCCHFQVRVTPMEAFLILNFLSQNPKTIDHQDLVCRIRNNKSLTLGKSLKDRVQIMDMTPCIFLEHGKCLVYPARPLICRAWVSFSSLICESAFLSRNFNVEIETSSVRNQVFSLVRKTLQTLCKGRGLKTVTLELPEAMERCFQTEDPIHEWFAGKDTFQEHSRSHETSPEVDKACVHSTASPFMAAHIPAFLQRFSLSYHREFSCIEYYLKTRGKTDPISGSLTLSHDIFAQSLYVSKFYPEIYKETEPRYHSAVCFYLILHHAAQQFHLQKFGRIILETRVQVFDSFYSRLLDFDFSVQHRRGLDNYGIQGRFHGETVNTAMITMTGSHDQP